MPPARREQQQRALGCGVVQNGCIQLVRNRHLRLDQHLLDAMPANAHAENGGCRQFGLSRTGRDFDATGLAALAGGHLRLEHARTEFARDLRGLGGRRGKGALRRVNPGRAQQRLGCVFLEVHGAAGSAAVSAFGIQATAA